MEGLIELNSLYKLFVGYALSVLLLYFYNKSVLYWILCIV